MHDVARLAGVSISTVSALINGAPKVSDARAERIRHAMQTLDYHPDQIARSLKMGRTHTIGVVIPDITNAFYQGLFRSVEDAARTGGYGVLLCNSNENSEQERLHLRTLFSRRVDGVLLACSIDCTSYEASPYRGLPVVFVDRIPRGIAAGAICTDNVDAGRIATEHLIELGHRRIAILAGNLGLSTHADRLEGFRQAMQRAALVAQEEYVCTGGMHVEDGQAAARLLLRLKEAPTAIIASNSKLLLGLLHVAREQHLTAPRDLSILTFDEHEWSDYLDPRITAVVQPTDEIGRRAFELLRAKLVTGSGAQHDGIVKLRAELRLRESTGRPPHR